MRVPTFPKKTIKYAEELYKEFAPIYKIPKQWSVKHEGRSNTKEDVLYCGEHWRESTNQVDF